ncbi:S8 family serine peptidase [Cellulomonas hominis]|uniref:S8 family serine peptidase n=1 Tax=Cellulomonas hominis TaxID=156981 RepID=UPI001B92AFF0|nr:S8 family serine peptidase [Cellulomonas hominis]VTR76884.1 Minor extracellular protease vpr [Cellulomonas hominis]
MTRRSLRASLTVLALAATTTLGAGGVATAGGPGAASPPAPLSPGDLATGAGDPVASDDVLAGTEDKVSSGLAEADGTVTAFVQLDTPSGLDVAEDGGDAAAVQEATAQVEQVAEAVVPAEVDPAARAAAVEPQRIATLSNLVSGALVTGDAAQVRALAGSDDVVAVYRVTTKTADNSSTDAFTRALQVWQDTGETGEGIRIGIIDTGLDYTHADFGGPGTLEAYAAAYGEDGTQPVPEGLYDPAKFLGGHDFAGPLYDADPASELPGATLTPTEDTNPIDSVYTSDNSGHGTHVAGSAAGYGVQADGTTFTGDYASLTDLSDWQVGPGAAPEAGLYALKVFGDIGGSTDLTGLALDWAADPDGDGDFGDHLDVVNLSLGASATPSDDPDNLLIDRLSDLGTLAVLSAGNSADITDVGGSPGSAASGLTVANSVGSPQTYDGVEVTQAPDPALVRTWSAQNSIAYAGAADVTAPVVYLGDDVDGCTPLTPYADQIAGNIVYLWWDDDDATRACGSVARFNAAEAAGAAGVLLGTESTVFAAGISGNATIPGAQLTASSTDALLPAIQAGGVTAHIGPSLAAAVTADEVGDALNPGSSRGAHGSLGIIKPDVAAPGTLIFSAASGSGNAAQSLSGTSMASPHVAGIAALVRATQPGWTPAQVKAAVMNTATHDVWTGAGQTGTTYGPQRVGSGRVDARAAVAETVLAYGSEDPDQVSVTFGVVDVADETVELRKTVTVQNTGTEAATFDTAFVAATTTGGATITTSPATLTVPAGQQELVTLTLTADPATLEREIDPTSATSQGGVPREYVAALSGRLVLTSGEQELRVPVQAAPRLVSELTADPVSFADAGATTAPLTLSGRGVDSGGWTSLVAPLNLAATSPKLEDVPGFITSESAVASGDLRWVGWTSTAPQQAAAGGDPADGYLGVGIAVDGDWATLGQAVLPVIDWDVDADGTPDVETVVQKLSEAADVTVAATFDYDSGEVLDVQGVNGAFGDVDTTVFDNSVLVAPVSIAALGLAPGATPTATVWTYSDYAADPSGQLDAVEPFTVDPFDPPYWFDAGVTDALWYVGSDTTELTVHRSTTSTVTPDRLLVLHSHNADPTTRAQVLDVTVPAATPTTTTLAVSGSPRVGQDVTLTATVAPAEATGTVSFRDGETEIATAPVAGGTATATVRLGGGAHSLAAVFTPDSTAWAGSTSEAVSVDVRKAGSTTKVTLSQNSGRYGSEVSATVTVTGQGAVPTGTVEIRERDTVLGTGELVAGTGNDATVTIALPRDLKSGSHTLTAVFTGSADVDGSKSQRAYRVLATVPTITLDTPSWTVAKGATPPVTVTVSGVEGGPVAGGKVTVLVGIRPVATVPLTDGAATVTLPAVNRTTTVTALYTGDGGYTPTLTLGVLRVR